VIVSFIFNLHFVSLIFLISYLCASLVASPLILNRHLHSTQKADTSTTTTTTVQPSLLHQRSPFASDPVSISISEALIRSNKDCAQILKLL
jgi:hypothetical protein